MNLVILALATWRIANLLTDTAQAGPFNLLAQMRYRVGVRFDEHSRPYATTNLAEGVLCIYCCSVWAGIGWGALYACFPQAAFILALPFALSAAAIVLDRLLDKLGG